MDRHFGRALLICCLGAFGATSVLHANPINLYNTGVDASHVDLVGAGTTDPHYTIISGPGLSSPQSAVTFFNGAYLADGPTSRWISVNANGSSGGSGTYDFQLIFSLTGLNAATAQITGQFAADNHVSATKINGTTVGGATNDSYSAYSSFSITSGFVAGTNTLDFLVLDDSAPMAFRVNNLAGTANPIDGSVPEPSTWLTMGAGLLAVMGMVCARRRAASAR
jgi:PEP-CTERM motif